MRRKIVSEVEAKKFFEFIGKSKTFFISGHVRPDGDTVGSSLALKHFLNKIGKKDVDITMREKLPSNYNFLPSVESITVANKVSKKYDLALILECSDISRMGLDVNLDNFNRGIVIDHHQTNKIKKYNNNWINITYPEMASCAEIIFEIFKKGRVQIDKEIALCLYVGIVTDTGKFQWSNTNSHSFSTASELLKYGINTFDVYRNIYGNKSVKSLLLLGEVLRTLKREKVGNVWISYIYVSYDMYKKTATTVKDTEEFINYATSVKDTDVAVFFKEDGKNIRVSFRSDKIDVGRVAEYFGGGGHRNASGTTIEGSFTTVKKKVWDFIREIS